MTTVTQPKRSQYGNRRNAVTECAKLEVFLIKWTNSEGRENLSLVATGAKAEDGGLGVWVLGEEKDLAANLKVANKVIREGMRARVGGSEAGGLPSQAAQPGALAALFGSDTDSDKEEG